MNELCAYILDHLVLDLSGEFNMDLVGEMLVSDGSQEARDLRARLGKEKSPDQFLFVLLDCLRDSIRTGVTVYTVKDQVELYLEA